MLGAQIPLGFVRTRSGSGISSIPTQLEVGSGLRSSWLSLDRNTERSLGLAQAEEPAKLFSSPSLARRAAQLVDLFGLTWAWFEARGWLGSRCSARSTRLGLPRGSARLDPTLFGLVHTRR